MRRGWRTLGIVALAAAVVWTAALGDLAPFVVGGLLVLVNAAAFLWPYRKRIAPTEGASALVTPLTVCWLVVIILPAHNFSTRPSVSATSSVSVQPLLEVLATAAVGMVALATIRALEPSFTQARPPLYLMAVPVWVIATSSWSDTAPYAFVRGWQMLMIAFLAWATLALGRRDRAALAALTGQVLRWCVWIVLGLCALGAAFGPMYVAVARANVGRFTWIGAHPGRSGLVIATALVIAVSASSQLLKMRNWLHLGAVAALCAAMYLNHTRTAWVGLVVALVVALALRGAVSWVVRRIGVPIALAAVTAGVYYKGSAIWEYFLRNQNSDTLATGNGRLALWGIGFRALESTFDWVFGLGYGATRTVFIEEAKWAGEAHNSILAMLVGTGVLGTLLLVLMLCRTCRDMLRGRIWRAGTAGAAAASLLVLVVINGISSDTLAEPTIGFSIWYLVAAVALARIQADPKDPDRARATVPGSPGGEVHATPIV